MKPGEHRFNGVKCTDINKYFISNLFASAIYRFNGKFILEVFAPVGLMTVYESEEEETDLNMGERWARGVMNFEKSKWPLEHIDYYIEVNGYKIGQASEKSSSYRYEPKRNEEDIAGNAAIKESNTFENANEGFLDTKKLRVDEQEMKLPKSPSDCLTEIFNNSDFMDTLADAINSLPVYDPQNPNSEEESRKFFEELDKKERIFFNKLRKSVEIPEFLEKEPMMIADLVFREKDFNFGDEQINSLKFIVKNTRKYYLPRMNFSLEFGESIHTFGNGPEEWREYSDKIVIEGVFETKREEGLIRNIPEGKKAILVKFKTLDNLSVFPVFYTNETLVAYETSGPVLNFPKLLDEKGKDGFNKYMVFAGYVDEDAKKADFGLFQLIVDFSCHKEYVLI